MKHDTIVRKAKLEYLADYSPDALVMDEYIDALVGVTFEAGGSPRAVYDVDIILEILTDDGMTLEDAVDHLEYNIIGSCYSESHPIIIGRFDGGYVGIEAWDEFKKKNADSDEPISPGDDDGLDGRAY